MDKSENDFRSLYSAIWHEHVSIFAQMIVMFCVYIYHSSAAQQGVWDLKPLFSTVK